MIETDLIGYESDLAEVVSALGSEAEELKIKHVFAERDKKFINTVTVNGKVYAFGNVAPSYDGEIERKRYVKRYAKLSLYKALSAFLGKALPWGALTGIRPTKLAYAEIERTGDFEEFFTDTMKVSQEKTLLTKKVIETQKGIYEKNDLNTDFFVFIPFCPTRCKYCSFISSNIKQSYKLVDAYVESLIKEIKASVPLIKKLRSIYIGGGTPVALPPDKLGEIMEAIDAFNTGVEYTVEAGRPDALTAEHVELFKKHGVTRVCVNPQTFNQKTLDLLGRSHTVEDVFDKYELVKKDFSVNMDLIAGLEGESFEDFKYSLDTAVGLSPDNITVHTLCVKRGSNLAESGKYPPDGETAAMVDYAFKTLTERGYSPYYLYRQKYMSANLENVGYTKAGKACVYNVDVMEEISQNIACGANAISKRIFDGGERIERLASPKDIATYIGKTDKIIADKEKLFI